MTTIYSTKETLVAIVHSVQDFVFGVRCGHFLNYSRYENLVSFTRAFFRGSNIGEANYCYNEQFVAKGR